MVFVLSDVFPAGVLSIMVVIFLPRGLGPSHFTTTITMQHPEPVSFVGHKYSGLPQSARIIFFPKTSRVLPFAHPSGAHIDAGQWQSPCRRSGASSKRRRGPPCILITADPFSSPHGQEKVQVGFKMVFVPWIPLNSYCQPSLRSCLCESPLF